MRLVTNAIVAALLDHGRLVEFNQYHDTTVYLRVAIGGREYRVSIDDEREDA